jgi:hypothetical protein
MMVKQRYSDMIIAATEKIRELDAQINEYMGLGRFDRPMPVLKNDDEAFFMLYAMSREYEEKSEMLIALKEDRDEVMDELFEVFQ